MHCRKLASCHGNGANSRYDIPSGMALSAPAAVDTSTSAPKPLLAERARSERLRCTPSRLPNTSNCAPAVRSTPRYVSPIPSTKTMATWRARLCVVSGRIPMRNAPATAAATM